MHVWQLQEAKAKLTELINDAKLEPQIISRRGVNEMIVLNISKYHELLSMKKDIVSFFRGSPLCGVETEVTRDKSLMRELDL